MRIPLHTYIVHTIKKNIALGLLLCIVFCTTSIQPAYGQQVHQSATKVIPSTFTFTTSLSKNMTVYPDVMYLKYILDQDPRTAIASHPCISPVSDGYFDQATKDAVIRFQNLYRSEVLSPAGAKAATGIVGPYTRLKMNSLLRSPAYSGLIASSTPSAKPDQSQGLSQTASQFMSQVAQVSNTTTTDTRNNSAAPRILSINPTQPSICQQSITITGQNFSPTQNLLVGTLGTFVTTANTTATTSTSSIQSITLKLSDFTDYMFNQAIYAGNTREIKFTVMSNGQTSSDLVILRFTFPGEKRSSLAIDQISKLALDEGVSRINISGGTTMQNSDIRNRSLIRGLEQVDIQTFGKTSQGKLITEIGGDRALETLYQFIPTGQLTQSNPNVMNDIIPLAQRSNSSTNNESTKSNTESSGGGALSALAGIATGIGIAAGVNALFSSGASAVSAVSAIGTASIAGNFGGPLILNVPCTCSGSSLITVQDVRGYPLQLIFQPGVSILYAYGAGILRPGAHLLGDYIPAPIQCLVKSGGSCIPYGLPIGIVRQVGTSI